MNNSTPHRVVIPSCHIAALPIRPDLWPGVNGDVSSPAHDHNPVSPLADSPAPTPDAGEGTPTLGDQPGSGHTNPNSPHQRWPGAAAPVPDRKRAQRPRSASRCQHPAQPAFTPVWRPKGRAANRKTANAPRSPAPAAGRVGVHAGVASSKGQGGLTEYQVLGTGGLAIAGWPPVSRLRGVPAR